jgi:hypothetical protein
MFLRKTLLVMGTTLACLGSIWADELPERGSPSEAIQFVLFQPGQAPQVRPPTPEEQRLAEARAAAAAAAERTSSENLPSSITLIMQGDQLSPPGIAFRPPNSGGFPPAPRINAAILVPSVRGFKIAEGESPRPLDRFYFNFNYFDDVNKAVNESQGVLVRNMRAYRETFGFEKTFFDGDASIGFRLPINTLSADSLAPSLPFLGGTSTDFGDLSTIFKYAFWNDQETGNLASAGLAITATTGPSTFAGYRHIISPHNTTFQPYVGGIYHLDRLYVHGFSAIDVPAGSPDVTFFYNDVGVSYLLYINRSEERIVTALAPTFEVHVTTPLNHRGALESLDPVGTPDVVDLTFGATVEVLQDASFRFGFVLPVTGPRPFDYELQFQFTWVFGHPQKCSNNSSCCSSNNSCCSRQ